jgi:hypothetical protein
MEESPSGDADQEIPAFYANQMFVITLTRVRKLFLIKKKLRGL